MVNLVSSRTNDQSNGYSDSPIFSADGSKIAFRSIAKNLVAGDTNGVYDVFVKYLTAGAIYLVSSGGNSSSGNPIFSSYGSKIAFASNASNLVAGDTNGVFDTLIKTLYNGAIVASITGAVAGTMTEDGTLTAVGTVTVTDPDAGQTVF
ncbi:hypothetical protein ACFQS7_30490 [Dankookia sp. GCM10030260]|uniref:hypothetical protein n=1 Tax=Dankookia sp. GCM10030260 TaxID=3273390 RepID=UPI003609C58F